MNRKRGAITIEAAIVVPIFVVTILAVLYFMKILFIQDQIHSAMTKTAHNMAVHTVAIEKTKLISVQQEAYSTGKTSLEGISGSLEQIKNDGLKLQENARCITDYTFEPMDISMDMDFFGDDTTFDNIADRAIEAPAKISDMMGEIQSNMDGFLTSIESLMEGARSGITSIASMELIEFVNGVVLSKVTEQSIYTHLSKEQLEDYGVYSDVGYIDFSDSSYMLMDDTITLVAKYYIATPLISGIIEGIPIVQSLEVRAFTGAYDYGREKTEWHNGTQKEDPNDTYFYVSTEAGAECYHVFRCLRKDVSVGELNDRIDNHNQTVCAYCNDHYNCMDNVVYYTSDTSKLHYSKDCVKISSSNIIAMTKEEAEAAGYRTCDRTTYCTESLFGGD